MTGTLTKRTWDIRLGCASQRAIQCFGERRCVVQIYCSEVRGTQPVSNKNKVQTKMPGLNFSLLDQLTFYGAYHTNKWNQARH